MRLKSNNEIVQFLIHFFILEAVGNGLVVAVCWLFRLFGMPQLQAWCASTPHFHQVVFTLLLVLAMTLSIVKILKRK